MALSDEEKSQLAALQKKASEPDDDFNIEIWDETGAGAKVPFSQGKKWLERFGIGVEPPATEDPKTDEGDKGKGDSKVTQRYFGNKKAS